MIDPPVRTILFLGFVLYAHNHSNTIVNRRAKILYKNISLTLLQGFEKVIQGLRVRGSWRPNRNCNILTPTLMAVKVVSFSFSRCSTGGPRGLLCWVMAFFTASYQQLLCFQTPSGFPRAPSAGCGFPYHISSISASNSTATNLTSVFTELYNSSTPTRSPTRSLKSHVWSHQAEIISYSSQVTLFRCISLWVYHGNFFYLVPFRQPISAHAISSHNCH